MWLTLLTNWKLIVAALTTLVLAFGVAFIDIILLEKRQVKALESQKNSIISQCKQVQQVTEIANAKLSSDRDALNTRLNALRVRYDNQCVPIANATNIRASGARHATTHGIDANSLLNYAGEAEIYREQLIVCEKFIAAERGNSVSDSQ